MKVEIKKIDHNGRGIGEVDGKKIFISNTLPGEIVDAKVISDKKKYSIGEVTKYIKTSDTRIKPICPYFDKCGGCDLMHISYENQLHFKQNKIKEIINKFTDIDTEIIDNIVPANDNLYYRNKVTFQIQNEKIGFYEKKSNTVIDIDKCYISTSKINKILSKLKTLPLTGVKQIVVRTDDNVEEVMVILYLNKSINNNIFVDTLKDDITSLITVYKNQESVIYGSNKIVLNLDKYAFELSPSSFFQVNTNQCLNLYNKVLEFASPTKEDVVLDLYCGTGTIGIFLSSYCNQVYGVEINEDAIKNANNNKVFNNIDNIIFKVGDAKKVVSKLNLDPTIVIVDPPRKGLDKETITRIKKWRVKKIVYVSCDPMTFARDLNLLSDDYDIRKILPVDMFPNTSHVETVCLLTRKDL